MHGQNQQAGGEGRAPLSGTMGASTSGNPRDDVMDVEESVGLQEEASLAA